MAIKLLDEITINQIAAGEVVERPASVVKELVENSLDAGATRILVQIAADEITVQDNGCGMSAADLRLAIQRHATSKIEAAGDLARIRTYGFRGEALPSIAAVSRLELRSRRSTDDIGALLSVEAGVIVGEGPTAMPTGTQIAVRRLFFNTPVRAKFLRSERAELGRAVLAIERLALAQHHVAFQVETGGRQVLLTRGTGDPLETLIAVYGLAAARDAALGRGAVANGGQVLAVVGGAATARSDRRRQGVFVNGRPVYARGLLEVAETACPQGLLPARQHPLLLLYLELPPEDVDANVHPTKAEVRLSGESAIFAAVVQAVRASTGSTAVRAGAEASPPPSDIALDPTSAGQPARPSLPSWQPQAWRGPAERPAPQAEFVREEPGLWQVSSGTIGRLKPLGQAGDKWIVCDGPGGVFLIDQHAAHERIQFERLQTPGENPAGSQLRPGEAGAPRQLLAVPAAVDLGPAELTAWHEFRAELDSIGVETEAFGGATVIVRSLPVALLASTGRANPDPGALLQDVLAMLSAEGQGAALAPRLRARRALASCSAAIKSATALSEPEIEGLLRDLAACAEPLRCPHGRPTVVMLTHSELARRFGRS